MEEKSLKMQDIHVLVDRLGELIRTDTRTTFKLAVDTGLSITTIGSVKRGGASNLSVSTIFALQEMYADYIGEVK